MLGKKKIFGQKSLLVKTAYVSQLDFGMLRYCRFGGVLLVTWAIRTTSPILVPKRAFLYESSGQNSSSNSAESVGGVHSQEETSHWRFNSANETLTI